MWSGCFVPGAALIAGDTPLKKTDQNFCPDGAYILICFSRGEPDNLRKITLNVWPMGKIDTLDNK